MEISRGHLVVKKIVDTEEGEKVERGIFKPLEFFSEGYKTIPYNEGLASIIAEYYDLHVVPFTVLDYHHLIIDNQELELFGSFQDFIEKVVPLSVYKGDIVKSSATELVVLATIICNSDVTEENILVDEDGYLYLVDNGFSLGFHHYLEIFKREEARDSQEFWEADFFNFDNTKLRFPDRVLGLMDYDYEHQLIKEIQAIPPIPANHWFGEEKEEFEEEVIGALTNRIKYLPTLVWNQYKEG